MKIVINILILCSVIASVASAQGTSKIVVKQGKGFVFNVTSDNIMTMSVMGREQKTGQQLKGQSTLMANQVTSDSIAWTTKSKMSMKMLQNGKVKKDSTVQIPEVAFATDALGKIMGAVDAPDGASMSDPLSAFGIKRNNPYQYFFNPLLITTRQPGETWTEAMNDTNNASAASASGAKVQVRSKGERKTTFDGMVDTLKTKAYRIRTEVPSLSMEGEGRGNGMNMTMDGEGSSMIISYYSVADGVLLCQRTQVKMDMRLSIGGGQDMVLPMTIVAKSTSTRKK